MGNSDLIENAEIELTRLINVMHKEGLNYWEILGLLLRVNESVYLQSGAEYQVKGGN